MKQKSAQQRMLEAKAKAKKQSKKQHSKAVQQTLYDRKYRTMDLMIKNAWKAATK